MMRRLLSLLLLTGYAAQFKASQPMANATPVDTKIEADTAITTNQSSNNANAVLIFLDDQEKDELFSITNSFLAAFIQEAGPIIVSASLINNIRSAKIPDEKNPDVLFAMMKALVSTDNKTSQEKELLKSIIASPINFDSESTHKWTIKKINDFLYLLLPKKYLYKKNISPENVHVFAPQSQITTTEHMLGLKVNHLETVIVKTIKGPDKEPAFADYFIDSLNKIFVMTKEYTNQMSIPSLSVFIHGHGLLKSAICNLSLEQFTIFLSFLEKLQTRFLAYQSCYAAGVNTSLMYKDARAGAQETYSFPIITIALTDTPTLVPGVGVQFEDGIMKPYVQPNYDCFVQAITQPDLIQYSDAIQCIKPVLYEQNIPQIRYPGLPWFSILDYETVASIGSVMAKSRTAPLDITKFFAKQGKPSEPHALLLYARDIPFELIINTKMPAAPQGIEQNLLPKESETCYVPTIISMIPGAVVHFIKKISSSCNTAHDILANFYIDGLWYRKLFIIDEITAPFSARMSKALHDETATSGTLANVLIDVAPQAYTKYFTYKGNVYISHGHAEESNDDTDEEIMPVRANDEQAATYSSLLTKNSKQTVLAKAQQLRPETVMPEAFSAIRVAQEKKIESLKAPIATPVAQGALVKQNTVTKRSGKRNRPAAKTNRKRTSAKIYCKAKRSRRHS